MEKICVIGGAGFVGTSLCRLLVDKGNHVQIIDKKKPSFEVKQLCLDITDKGFLTADLSGASTIYNLAAEHRDDVRPIEKYYKVNVEGAKQVCKAATAWGVERIIFTSSVAVYGYAKPGTAENGEINYNNEYGRTKYLAEQIYIEWQKEAPLKRSLVIVRPAVIFGRGNRGNVYNLMKQIALGRFLMFGAGDNIKSMAYVENVAHFLEHCRLSSAGVHIYNYVDKPDMSVAALVGEIRRKTLGKKGIGLTLSPWIGLAVGRLFDLLSVIFGVSLPVSSIRIKKFMETTQFDSKAIGEDFSAPFSLQEGLSITLEHEFGSRKVKNAELD